MVATKKRLRDTKRKTAKQSRVGPARHASETDVGAIAYGAGGRTGKEWIVKALPNGSRRWVPLPGYRTMMNGSQPFYVQPIGNAIEIYSDKCSIVLSKKTVKQLVKVSDEYDAMGIVGIYSKLRMRISTYLKLFVGKNVGMFRNDREHGEFPGSSVLVKITPNKYVFVCDRIVEFATPTTDVITEFYSIMGNSSVPYSYAVGKDNTYLLSEQVFIPNEKRDKDVDPYVQYYNDRSCGRKMRVKTIAKPYT